MSKRYPSNTSTSPRFMPPISPPGQREYRKLTMREEILRVPLIVATQSLLALISLISTYLIIAIVGPIVGYILILTTITLIAKKLYSQKATRPILITIILLWLVTGYPLCASIWISNPTYFLHPFAQIAVVIGYLFIDTASLWGVYILWVEITDPNWPSPRQAVLRDGPYIPGFSTETYGGQVLPDISTIASLPSRTITVQLVKDDNGKHTESVAHIPDLTNWKQFFYAVAHHGKGFTEATARAYNVPLTDTRDQADQLIVIGMRTLREQFLSRGWLEWKNPSVHERGLNITPKGQVVMEAIGKES